MKLRKLVLNIVIILVLISASYAVSYFLFTSIPVKGTSMLETIQDKDRVLLLRVGEYKRGDIVVFNSDIIDPNDDNPKILIKRIVGLPGDTVEISYDDATDTYFTKVNGEVVDEPYIGHQGGAKSVVREVQDGEFFFLGDNRAVSLDSRSGHIGTLNNIIGRVVMRYSTSGDIFFDLIKRGE